MNKASGSDGIPVELFQILKDDAVKVLHSICQEIWNTQQQSQDWKRSVFIPIPKKGNAKECSNYHTIALISHATKVMLKILQARLQTSKKLKIRSFFKVKSSLLRKNNQTHKRTWQPLSQTSAPSPSAPSPSGSEATAPGGFLGPVLLPQPTFSIPPHPQISNFIKWKNPNTLVPRSADRPVPE